MGETFFEPYVLGKLPRTQELQQAEEPVGIVFERRCAQEQNVATQARDGSDGAPAGLARVAFRAPEPLRFIHNQQVDSRPHGLIGGRSRHDGERRRG